MSETDLVHKLTEIVTLKENRAQKALKIAQIIRESRSYRWVGIYDVDHQRGIVSNIAWSGPGAPAYPSFPLTKGITSRAIATQKTINVGNVGSDSDYLTALGSTQSEIIVPVLDDSTSQVIGTIDVESEVPNAFDSGTQALLEQCARALRNFWTANV